LASNLLRGLLSALFRLYPPADTGATIVLATPQGERHEFGILLAALYAATHGWRAIYLGADLPAREIVRAVKLSGAQVLALSLVTSPVAETEQELWAIAEQLSRSTRVWLGGGAAADQQDLITRAGWSWLGDLEELDEWLKS
jgi:MerR family transcriptional regulator, light-induced transcriptional regulator